MGFTKANDLLSRLGRGHLGRFSEAQLRTLQRRVEDWRGDVAKRLASWCF